MKVANYYPQQSRLDLIGQDNIPSAVFIGVDAHIKAVNLATQGTTVIFINIDSKANQKTNKSNKNA
jgi:hypothetical protein